MNLNGLPWLHKATYLLTNYLNEWKELDSISYNKLVLGN